MKTYDRTEAAEFLKCDEDTVSTLRNTGKLRGAKIGRALVFMEDDLVEFLRDQVRQQSDAIREMVEAAAVPTRRGRKPRPRPDLP